MKQFNHSRDALNMFLLSNFALIVLFTFLSQLESHVFKCLSVSSKICHIPFEFREYANENDKILEAVEEIMELRIEVKFKLIPEAVFTNFSNIRTLSMPNTGLRILNQLHRLRKLKVLHVENNNLTELDDSSLSQNLEELHAQKNLISRVHADTFKNSTNLIKLVLSKNRITSLPRYVFQKCLKLKVLVLSENEIKSIEGVIDSCLSLQRLSIAKNFIEIISNKTFHGLSQLSELDLSYNMIHTVDENAFSTNIMLAKIYLNNNYLSNYVMEIMSSDLIILHLQQNFLEAIFITSHLKFTQFLSIFAAKNQLTQFNVQKNIPLMILDLGKNNLTSLKGFNFKEASVDILKLSNNNVSSMDFNYFRKFKNLREIHLNDTNLDEKRYRKILKIQSLVFIDASYNINISRFNYTHVSAPNLLDLKLNACNLRRIYPKELRHGLPNLKKLGISGNKFNCSKTKDLLSKLTEKNGYKILVELVETGKTIRGIGCVM